MFIYCPDLLFGLLRIRSMRDATNLVDALFMKRNKTKTVKIPIKWYDLINFQSRCNPIQ